VRPPPFRQRNELIAQVDERHPGNTPSRLEREEPTVKRERRFEVFHLKAA
jgi:hypothetical protein